MNKKAAALFAKQQASIPWGQVSTTRQQQLKECINVYEEHKPDNVTSARAILNTMRNLSRENLPEEEEEEDMDEYGGATGGQDEEQEVTDDLQVLFLVGYFLVEHMTLRTDKPPMGWQQCSDIDCEAAPAQFPSVENEMDGSPYIPTMLAKSIKSNTNVEGDPEYYAQYMDKFRNNEW